MHMRQFLRIVTSHNVHFDSVPAAVSGAPLKMSASLLAMKSLWGSSYNLTRKEGSSLRLPILDLAQPPWPLRSLLLLPEAAAEVFNGLSKWLPDDFPMLEAAATAELAEAEAAGKESEVIRIGCSKLSWECSPWRTSSAAATAIRCLSNKGRKDPQWAHLLNHSFSSSNNQFYESRIPNFNFPKVLQCVFIFF